MINPNIIPIPSLVAVSGVVTSVASGVVVVTTSSFASSPLDSEIVVSFFSDVITSSFSSSLSFFVTVWIFVLVAEFTFLASLPFTSLTKAKINKINNNTITIHFTILLNNRRARLLSANALCYSLCVTTIGTV